MPHRRAALRALLLLALSASLLACSGEPKKPDKLTDAGPKLPAHFALIPADTPYVVAELQPMPLELSLLQQWGGRYGEVVRYARESLSGVAGSANPDVVSRGMLLYMSVLEELDGKTTTAGLKSLGFNPSGSYAIYGLGLFPVARIDIQDVKAFEAMIGRVEKRIGQPFPTRKLTDTMSYRVLNPETAVAPDQLLVALGVVDNQAVLSIAPVKTADRYLKMAFGLQKPERSLAVDNRLKAVAATHELKPYSVGMVDIVAITRAMIQPGTGLIGQSLRDVEYSTPQLPPACAQEYNAIAAKVPRFVMGYRGITTKSFDYHMGIELDPALTSRYRGAVAPVPGSNSAMLGKAMFFGGLGLDLNKLAEILQSEAGRLSQAPFQCPNLAELNDIAQQASGGLQQIPPFVLSITGVAAALRDFEFKIDQANPSMMTLSKVDASLALMTADPQGLYSALQAFVPDLQKITLKPDGSSVPVALPADVMQQLPPGLPQPEIVMTPTGLGGSLGVAGRDDALSLLKSKDDGSGSMMVVGYNINRAIERVEQGLPAEAREQFMREIAPIKATYGNFDSAVMRLALDGRGLFVTVHGDFVPTTTTTTP